MSGLPSGITVTTASFGLHAEAIRALRHEVFVVGQDVPEDEEWDGQDELPTTVHLLALAADGAPLGTARLLPGGRIGRMAVRASHRRQGIGGALLEALVALARARGVTRCVLGAQMQAIPFYEKHGFAAQGGVFLDAGIEHRIMSRDL